MFAEDTTSAIASQNDKELCASPNVIIPHISDWFRANGLLINTTEMQVISFQLNNNKNI